MCGRYWIDLHDDGLVSPIPDIKRSGEIQPGDTVPALCFSRSGKLNNFAMQWGWHLSGGKLLINIRSETANEKGLFADSILHRRCLLPMSAYFEWHTRGKDKIKYRIYPETAGKYYLAALYRWEGNTPVFSVLTCDAAEEISFIHDRMPIIVSHDVSELWLRSADLSAPKPLTMDFALAL